MQDAIASGKPLVFSEPGANVLGMLLSPGFGMHRSGRALEEYFQSQSR
jgi:hypothetical protein